MNEKRKNALPVLLALASLVTLASFFMLFLLTSAESGHPSGGDGVFVHNMRTIAECLLLMGWIPGLALAVVSLAMLRRLRSQPVKFATLVLSSLAILAVIFWALAIYTLLRPG